MYFASTRALLTCSAALLSCPGAGAGHTQLKVAPNDRDHHANRSGVLGLMGRWREAASAAEEAVACDEISPEALAAANGDESG